MSYGTEARVGVNFQVAYGTPATSSLHWLEPISDSVDLKKAQNKQSGLRGVFDEGRSQEGPNSVDGSISIEAKPIQLGVLLHANFSRSTVTSGALYTHTFVPRQADFSALCAEAPMTLMKYMGTGSAHLYGDCAANGLSIEIANGELVRASMDVVGGTFSQTAAVAASYTDQNALDWSVSSISFGGTAKTNIRAMNLNVGQGLEAKHSMGETNRYPNRIKRTGFRTISVGGTLIFDDQTEYQQFVAQTEQRLLVHLRGVTEVQSGYVDTLTIDAPAMRFTQFPQAIPGAGEIEVSFQADCKYHVGSGNALTITLQNGRAGY